MTQREPIFDRIRADIAQAEADVAGWFHPRGDVNPYPETVTTITPEDTVNISNIGNDIKNAVEQADQWIKTVAETHLPALAAEAAKAEASPIAQALEGALLPPQVEADLASMIAAVAAKYPAPPAADVPVADAPAQPATVTA